MATQAGIGVLIGLGIGSGVTAFLMRRIIRLQDNALQQSLNRLNRIQEDHSQDLTTALAKLETDYEQQLARTIERYQDSHEEQLTELQAEYEARIEALLSINALASEEDIDPMPATTAPPTTAASVAPLSSDSASTDYEQQLARTIERYQASHEEQLTELQAEYEARIEALLSVNAVASEEDIDPMPATTAPPTTAASVAPTSSDSASSDGSASPSEFTQLPIDDSLPLMPDPWTEATSSSVTVAPPPLAIPAIPEPDTATENTPANPTATSTDTTTAAGPEATAPPAKKTSQVNSTKTAAELGKAAAINRKDAIRAIPQLGKLFKDSDADVRLAAVTALQESGSIKAIPLLRQALRDTDSRIVATASAALSRFKGSKKPAPKAKVVKKKPRH